MPPNTVNRRDLLRLGLSGVAIPVAALTGAASPVEAQSAVAAVSAAAGNAEPFAASRVTDLARALAAEAQTWIAANLGPSYPWPGNIRELEQCVRNVLVRGEYRPARPEAEPSLAEQIEAGRLTADELLDRYCASVYRSSGSYEAAARRLRLDRRTVKARVSRFARSSGGLA